MSAAARREAAAPLADLFSSLGVDEARLDAAEVFRALIAQENVHTNLVGASTLDQFWTRHFLDSAQLLAHAPAALTWADLGAGAGFPGVVLAILLQGRPGAKIHLVESMAKRCRFLERVVSRLDLPAEVRHGRAETMRIAVEIVTARACAPLTRLLGFSEPFFVRGARGLFLKGREVDREVAEARMVWSFREESFVSLSDQSGRILSVRELNRVRRP
jgi:16S rRNA (guanine527-N7)-methyltransferase